MNAQAKHAPGPYFVTPGTYPRIQDASGRNIAKTDCSLNGDSNWEKDPEKARANADLLATAPEMAEALAKIAAGAATDCGPNRLGTVNLDKQAMQAIARATLAKAGLLS